MKACRQVAAYAVRSIARQYERLLESPRKGSEEPTAEGGKEVHLTIMPYLEPSSFEITMMGKLQAMISPNMFAMLQRRSPSLGGVQFSNPAAQKIWNEICEDRRRIQERAILDGSFNRRRSGE